MQSVGCLPRPGRGPSIGAVVLLADPRPLDGDLAEGRLKGELSASPRWIPAPALPGGSAGPAPGRPSRLGPGSPALDLKAGLMDEASIWSEGCWSWEGTGKDILSDSCSEKA